MRPSGGKLRVEDARAATDSGPNRPELVHRSDHRRRIAATAVETAELAFYNKHGQLIWSEPRGVAAGYASAQFSIHRDELQMPLFAAARTRLPERAVIAVDGIHSTVRRTFFPDEGPARFSGRMLWRATTRAKPFLTGRSTIQAGHQDQKFVRYPIQRTPDVRGAAPGT